jgi:hypothetical protein
VNKTITFGLLLTSSLVACATPTATDDVTATMEGAPLVEPAEVGAAAQPYQTTFVFDSIATTLGSRIEARLTDPRGLPVLERELAVSGREIFASSLAAPAGIYRLQVAAFDDAGTQLTAAETYVQASEQMGSQLVKVGIDTRNAPEIEFRADRQPRLESLDVLVDDQGRATLTANAHDPEGGPLIYKWGSRALDPVVITGQEIRIEPASVEPGSHVVNLVVQDGAGGLASARITFSRDNATCALCGTRKVVVEPTPSVDEPCVMSHARCVAGCDMRDGTPEPVLDLECTVECAGQLALCRTNPS